MSEQKLRSLLVVMQDYPAEFEAEMNLWFDHDHVPERLSIEGIEDAERFQLLDLEPIGWRPSQRWSKYINIYTLTSTDVLVSKAYTLQYDRRGAGQWRQSLDARMAASSRDLGGTNLRTSWRQRPDSWSTSRPVEQLGPRTALVILRNDGGEADAAANAVLDEQLIPELLHVPGVLGCERYEAEGEPAESGEQPKYLDLVHLTSPEVAVTGVFRRWVASLELSPEVRAALTPVGYGVYGERPSPWRVAIR